MKKFTVLFYFICNNSVFKPIELWDDKKQSANKFLGDWIAQVHVVF